MLVAETFHGYIETTQDVLLVFEGCRRGLLPRICRRLQERERKLIRSGSVFVFDERESGIKRWTDGRVWSPSRILGNFLIYRELDKRALNDKKMSLSDARQRSYSADHPASDSTIDRNRERQLVGSLSDSYKFRKDGLIKKTMSIVINGVSQHLISYYHPQDVLQNKLRTPSSVPELASLEISPELLVKQNFRIPPMVEPTFDHPEVGGPLTPPDSGSGVYSDRRNPLRSMSLGSLRQDMNMSVMYQPPYQRMDVDSKQSPTMSYSSQSMHMYPQNGFSVMPSPSSMSSSPSTPMLSPVRPSFQHQRHFSTSSVSTSRFDPRSYGDHHQQAQAQHHQNLAQIHPHMVEAGYSEGQEPQRYASAPNLGQASTPNLGQLLNPVHPLHNTPESSHHHPSLLHSMAMSSQQSGYSDYTTSMAAAAIYNTKTEMAQHSPRAIPSNAGGNGGNGTSSSGGGSAGEYLLYQQRQQSLTNTYHSTPDCVAVPPYKNGMLAYPCFDGDVPSPDYAGSLMLK
ncbi:hypothetical protein DFQ28_010538 [Apophysomyces sp. BC1034]|nr:hypothetical protein DFQ30_010154 [Apophysomyces sp. BC1015]KAG0171029.1 hypothetical protein DFQ29_009029 [Apophysomyces sp. BC1021]KAG0184755.1 hypothetical protein DFQ28_010538 [Apophysomyces sp. BC1034]